MEQSTKAYEPGTVALATVRNVPETRVVRVDCPTTPTWMSVAPPHPYGCVWHADSDVTDVRPLVVIDLGDYDNRAVTYLRNIAREDRAFDGDPTPRAKLVNLIADQIEAQTKPPRIPEPGLWGVVEARLMHGGNEWTLVHHHNGWIASDGGVHQWRSLIDPTLIREGVES